MLVDRDRMERIADRLRQARVVELVRGRMRQPRDLRNAERADRVPHADEVDAHRITRRRARAERRDLSRMRREPLDRRDRPR